MSTLDHLTDGRVGWNIVTGYLQSAAQGTGQADQPSHDTRYEMAEEYMEVMYRLWEGSWADDAMIDDRAAGVLTDPARVHKIHHHGRYFDVDGFHLSEPSPQRTPVLYQAGGSPAGRAFAARHAECVFLGGGSRTTTVARAIADVRSRAAAAGRDPADLKMFPLMTVIVARTNAEAEDRVASYRDCIVPEAALALASGWSGVDFAQWRLDDEVQNLPGEGIQGTIKALQLSAGDGALTVRHAAAELGLGGAGAVIAGSPTCVADELERWIDETDADGFNLTRVVIPETYDDIVALLVPELQRRGRYKQAYEPGTFRQKLLGKGPWLAPSHVGRSYRRT
jgi:alkanesulfonate monooxygenase